MTMTYTTGAMVARFTFGAAAAFLAALAYGIPAEFTALAMFLTGFGHAKGWL
jgi:hypothetical protein